MKRDDNIYSISAYLDQDKKIYRNILSAASNYLPILKTLLP
jgi:hypothetical protein